MSDGQERNYVSQNRHTGAFIVRTLIALAFFFASLTLGGLAQAQIVGSAQLNIERRAHTATLLDDGKVLIVGGDNQNGMVSQTELLDPVAQTATLGASLATARTDHSATKLADGRVVIIGGRDASGPLTSIEVYDPSTATFSAGPSLSTPRAGHSATTLSDGTIIVAGGDANGTAEIYDPLTQNMSLVTGSLTTSRRLHSAILIQYGQVLIVGGVDAANNVLKTAEVFDPPSQSFYLPPSDLKTPRALATLKLLADGKVQVIGGDADSTMEVLDPDLGWFNALADLPPTVDTVEATLKTQSRAALISPTIGQDQFLQGVLTPEQLAMLDRADHSVTELPAQNKALIAGGISSTGQVLNSATFVESSSASVTTDKTDYPPGSIVTITGQGFSPNEEVEIRLHETPDGYEDPIFLANADAQGQFVSMQFSPQAIDLGKTFMLTAVGKSSGFAAQTAFTDSHSITAVTPNYGPLAGGTAVIITGTDFADGAGADGRCPCTATFGSAGSVPATFVSDTQLSATTPLSATAQTVTVTVSFTDGSNQSLSNAFTYTNHTITSATVNGVASVAVASGTSITGLVNVTTSGTWGSTRWRISNSPTSGGTTSCVNHSNHGSGSETVNMSTTGLANGTYAAHFIAYTNDTCTSGASAIFTLPNAVTISSRITQSARVIFGGTTVPTDASSITVPPGATISANVTGSISGADWDSTGWAIHQGAAPASFEASSGTTATLTRACANTTNFDPPGTFTTANFNITAPTTPGTYNASFRISGDDDNDDCNNQIGTVFTLLNAIIVQSNSAPTGTDKTVTTNEDTDYTFVASDFGFSDPDAGDVLTAVRIDSLPLAGSLTNNGSAVAAATVVSKADIDAGFLKFSPAANASGSPYASFTFSVKDASLFDTTPNTMMINVTADNDAPTASNMNAAQSYTEDTPLNLIDIVIGDIDSANVTATLTLSNTAAGSLSTATSGAVTSTFAAGTGIWTASGPIADVNALLAGVTFNPAANFNSNFNITTFVSDSVAAPVTGSKAMTGIPVNDVPSFTKGGNQTVTEDAGPQSVSAWATAISAGPTDEAGQILTFNITGNTNPGLFSAAPAVNATGTLTYTPALNINGSATITLTLSDNGGTTNGGVDTSAAQNFTIMVTAVNDAPQVTGGTLASQSVQYSDPITSGTILVTDVDNGGAALSLTGVPSGLTVNKSCTDSPGVVTGETQTSCTFTVSGNVQDAPGSYPISVTDGTTPTATGVTITVTKEDSWLDYTGQTYYSTVNSAVAVPLTFTIRDITALGGADTAAGNISNARVTIKVNGSAPAGCANLTPAIVGGDTKVGTVNCVASLAVDTNGSYTVTAYVSNYYRGDGASDVSVSINVAPASATNFISGGGFIINSNSQGMYAGAQGLKSNFGFNVKYNKRGTNLQGNANIIVRGGGKVYQFKANSLQSLSVNSTVVGGTATFVSKANVTDITDPENSIPLVGNLSLTISLDDQGEPGKNDKLAIAVYNGSTLLYSSSWNGVSTALQNLNGGNIVVH